jgi:hypothetical protein
MGILVSTKCDRRGLGSARSRIATNIQQAVSTTVAPRVPPARRSMDGKVTQSVDTTGQVRGDVTFTWEPPAD